MNAASVEQDWWLHSLLEFNMARCVLAWNANHQGARGRVVVTLWATWYARRKAVHANIFEPIV
jgi:hypothetical protein